MNNSIADISYKLYNFITEFLPCVVKENEPIYCKNCEDGILNQNYISCNSGDKVRLSCTKCKSSEEFIIEKQCTHSFSRYAEYHAFIHPISKEGKKLKAVSCFRVSRW